MWQGKRKVAIANGGMKLDVNSTASADRRSRRKNGGGKKTAAEVGKFFNNIGTSIESLIDATPLGVSTCEPWNPSTDKKKAALSNPISVINTVSETVDALSPSGILTSLGDAGSSWIYASSRMLLSLREGLANAVLAEEAMMDGNLEKNKKEDVDAPPVMVEIEVDVAVPSETGDESFVDLGADRWGNSSRSSSPAKETMSEVRKFKKAVSRFLNKTALPFIDNLTLRANGIVVTSDDCSVECSLASLIHEDEFEAFSVSSDGGFEECPSVVTEIMEDEDDLEDEEEDTKDAAAEVETTKVDEQVSEEGDDQETKAAVEGVTSEVDDDQEYVMTEEPDSDDEFVMEFDMTYCP